MWLRSFRLAGKLEEFITAPALVSDLLGFIGMIVCAIVMLVLWTKRKTVEDVTRLRKDA